MSFMGTSYYFNCMQEYVYIFLSIIVVGIAELFANKNTVSKYVQCRDLPADVPKNYFENSNVDLGLLISFLTKYIYSVKKVFSFAQTWVLSKSSGLFLLFSITNPNFSIIIGDRESSSQPACSGKPETLKIHPG